MGVGEGLGSRAGLKGLTICKREIFVSCKKAPLAPPTWEPATSNHKHFDMEVWTLK